MPQSLVINLTAKSAIAPKYLQGYALQQLFFSLLDLVDPELGHILRRDKQNRSYSLSSLQLSPTAARSIDSISNANRSTQPSLPTSTWPLDVPLDYACTQAIPAGSDCWWRLSFLDDALFEHLIFLWNQLRDQTFSLGPARVKIGRIATDLSGADWVSRCSYSALYEQASPYERDIHLQFVTPAAFETALGMTPLPTADAIFQPLRKYWNCYSGLVFAPSLVSYLIPTYFDIATQPVQVNLRHSFQTVVGCTGCISFRIGGQGDPFLTKRINALADFAQYCGVGFNTRLGLGIVKRTPRQQLCSVQSHKSS